MTTTMSALVRRYLFVAALAVTPLLAGAAYAHQMSCACGASCPCGAACGCP